MALVRNLFHIHRFRVVNATTMCEHHYPLVNTQTMHVGVGNVPHESNEYGEPQCRFLIYYSCRCGQRRVEAEWSPTPEEPIIGRK